MLLLVEQKLKIVSKGERQRKFNSSNGQFYEELDKFLELLKVFILRADAHAQF